MKTNQFKDLVNKAFKASEEFYKKKSKLEPNPFYIGFGSPSAKILILGQEKAIAKTNTKAIFAESVRNTYHWQKILTDNISDLNYEFSDTLGFKTPLHPYYPSFPKANNTWKFYQDLVNILYPKLLNSDIGNSFFSETFITEVNHKPSTTKTGRDIHEGREDLMNHPFYKSFPITIIATGSDYLKESEIEQKFAVKLISRDPTPYKRFFIFEDKVNKRILINTRQFSQFYYSTDERIAYFNKIAEPCKKFL